MISDTWFPGWNGYIDESPADIYPGNMIFRALYLGEGVHQVNLRYQPTSFLFGIFVSGFSMIIILILKITKRLY